MNHQPAGLNEYPIGDQTSMTLTKLAKGQTLKVKARTR